MTESSSFRYCGTTRNIGFLDAFRKRAPFLLIFQREKQKWYVMNPSEILTTAYTQYMKELKVSAFYKVHDTALSEDLVQDTFMKTWLYLVKGGKIKMMRAFLYHVLNNLVIDEYRKQKNKAISLDEIAEKGYEPGEDESQRLYDFLDGEAALSSIKRIPLKYQQVMRMRYAQGLSLKEMSAISGQSKNTVSVQAYRGLVSLRHLHSV